MSIATSIRDAAATAIAALNLTPTPTVKARKRPTLPAGVNPPAIVTACNRVAAEPLYAGVSLVKYNLTVAVYVATLGEAQDVSPLDDWIQSIGRKLDDRATFAAVANTGPTGAGTGINEIDRVDGDAFTEQAAGDLYNHAALNFTVEVIEPRN